MRLTCEGLRACAERRRIKNETSQTRLSRGTPVEQPLPRSLLKNILAASLSSGNGSNGLLWKTKVTPNLERTAELVIGRKPHGAILAGAVFDQPTLRGPAGQQTLSQPLDAYDAAARLRPTAFDPP